MASTLLHRASLLAALALMGCAEGALSSAANGDAASQAVDAKLPADAAVPLLDLAMEQLAFGCGLDLAAPPCAPGCVCDPDQPQPFWDWAAQQPIVLPNHVGGFNMVPPGSTGLTVAEAKAALCATSDGVDVSDAGVTTIHGGDVSLGFSGRYGSQVELSAGYAGLLAFRGADCVSTYVMQIGAPIQKNGAWFTIDWNDAVKLPAEADELYRGMMSTFLPAVVLGPPGTPCTVAKTCTTGKFGSVAYIYVKALGFALWVDDINGKPPRPSTPSRFDLFATKLP